jgi:quercetin dioxygenase-like cupin family protein
MSFERKLLSLAKNPKTGRITEFFGPTVEFLTSPEDEQNDFCVVKGTIPPGISVPLHAHADIEDFFVISGSVEALQHEAQGYTWITAQAGDFIHVPANARHAWRNVSEEPLVNLIITTKRLGRFFQEAGRPATGTRQPPPTPEELPRFAAISAKDGYWNATPRRERGRRHQAKLLRCKEARWPKCTALGSSDRANSQALGTSASTSPFDFVSADLEPACQFLAQRSTRAVEPCLDGFD